MGTSKGHLKHSATPALPFEQPHYGRSSLTLHHNNNSSILSSPNFSEARLRINKDEASHTPPSRGLGWPDRFHGALDIWKYGPLDFPSLPWPAPNTPNQATTHPPHPVLTPITRIAVSCTDAPLGVVALVKHLSPLLIPADPETA